MRVGPIPAGIAALGVALAFGFAWEMRGPSGGTNANGQLRSPAVRVLARGDRLDSMRRALERSAVVVAQQGFTSRFSNAFAARQMEAVDEASNDEAATGSVLAYAPAQTPERKSQARRDAPASVAAAPKRSIAPPEQTMRLASLESTPASPAGDDLDGRTAIYDISAHTIYLPGGEKLEAHSGLGSHIDDPHSMSLRNRGVTPPNVYRLALREHIFHGVRALRLIPVGDRNMFGRDGILAHSYMLGPKGASNGCMAVRNYPALLQAFLSGKVERLVVVEHMSPSSSRIASLR
jgi:hypothetical protein